MKKTSALAIFTAVMMSSTNAISLSDDYYKCVNTSNKQDDGYAQCFLDEAKRDVATIDSMYQKLSSNPKFSAWNNGNGMFKGNFKDMLDTWISFRNRYCSLYAETYSQYDGSSKSYHQADCIMKLTQRHAQDMQDMWMTSVSEIDGSKE